MLQSKIILNTSSPFAILYSNASAHFDTGQISTGRPFVSNFPSLIQVRICSLQPGASAQDMEIVQFFVNQR